MPVVDFHLLVRHDEVLYVCNPAHYYPDPTAPNRVPTIRTASHRDVFMTLSAASTEILDMLAAEYAPHELSPVAQTLGYSESEIAQYQRQEDAGKLDPHEGYFKTFLIAEVACAVIQHRGAITDPDIVGVSEAVLPEWEEHFLDVAREIFDQMVEVEKTVTSGCVRENPRWRDLYAGKHGFQRKAFLLSQAQMRLGRFAVEVKEDTPPSEAVSAAD